MLSTRGGESIKQVLIRVPDEIHAKLKLKTIQENTSIQELIGNFIVDYVNEVDMVDKINVKNIDTDKLMGMFLTYSEYLDEMEVMSKELKARLKSGEFGIDKEKQSNS